MKIFVRIGSALRLMRYEWPGQPEWEWVASGDVFDERFESIHQPDGAGGGGLNWYSVVRQAISRFGKRVQMIVELRRSVDKMDNALSKVATCPQIFSQLGVPNS